MVRVKEQRHLRLLVPPAAVDRIADEDHRLINGYGRTSGCQAFRRREILLPASDLRDTRPANDAKTRRAFHFALRRRRRHDSITGEATRTR